jgi:hypothetical protein
VTNPRGHRSCQGDRRYVKAFHAAELDERIARIEQLSDAELMRIARGSRQTDVTSAPQSPKPLILTSR